MPIHDVIYVPGIGDTKTTIQELAVGTWKLYGVVPHTFPMRWADKEPFAPKFSRLLAYIDGLLAEGHAVSLVGASAGASVVLNAFTARPNIHGIVTIAGKINHPEAIGEWYQRNAPAFVQSAKVAQNSLASLDTHKRRKINSRYAIIDLIVPKKDSIVPDAKNTTVLSIGHSTTIAIQLLFGAPNYIRFLKRLSK
jgi:hypothetical protein